MFQIECNQAGIHESLKRGNASLENSNENCSRESNSGSLLLIIQDKNISHFPLSSPCAFSFLLRSFLFFSFCLYFFSNSLFFFVSFILFFNIPFIQSVTFKIQHAYRSIKKGNEGENKNRNDRRIKRKINREKMKRNSKKIEKREIVAVPRVFGIIDKNSRTQQGNSQFYLHRLKTPMLTMVNVSMELVCGW